MMLIYFNTELSPSFEFACLCSGNIHLVKIKEVPKKYIYISMNLNSIINLYLPFPAMISLLVSKFVELFFQN